MHCYTYMHVHACTCMYMVYLWLFVVDSPMECVRVACLHLSFHVQCIL